MKKIDFHIYETSKGEFPNDYEEVIAYGHYKKRVWSERAEKYIQEDSRHDDWYLCNYTEHYGFSKTKGNCAFMKIKYWTRLPSKEVLSMAKSI